MKEQDVPKKAFSLLLISCFSCQQAVFYLLSPSNSSRAQQRLLLSLPSPLLQSMPKKVLMMCWCLEKLWPAAGPQGFTSCEHCKKVLYYLQPIRFFTVIKNQTVKKVTFSLSPRINAGICGQKQKPDHLVNCSSPEKSLNCLRVTFLITGMDV